MTTLRVKLSRSMISEPQKMRKIARALGLRKVNAIKEFNDNNCIRGMVNKIKHLVEWEVVNSAQKKTQ